MRKMNTKHEENDTSIIDNKLSSKSQRLHLSASDKGMKFALKVFLEAKMRAGKRQKNP